MWGFGGGDARPVLQLVTTPVCSSEKYSKDMANLHDKRPGSSLTGDSDRLQDMNVHLPDVARFSSCDGKC